MTPNNEIVTNNEITPKHQGAMNRAPTLGNMIRTFKAVATRKIRLHEMPEFRWQRNYYEHVVRDEKDLNHIRQYIMDNPIRWEMDPENHE